MKKSERLKIWIKVICDYCCSFFPSKAKILSSEETIDFACTGKKSIIRFGDGEFNIIQGGNVHYQEYNADLERDMLKILNEYSEKSPYLLCVPYRYFSKNNLVLNRRVLIACLSTLKKIFKRYINKYVLYGDAFIFSKNNSKKSYQRIWKDSKAIVLVHNNEMYLKEAFDSKRQKGFFVKVPSKNSYEIIDKIEDVIEKIYIENDLLKENTAVLLSAGPAAKVLAYRMALNGYRMIDCGHVWDDPLEV